MQSHHFHPAVERWFEQKFGSPTEPQLRGWPAIQSGAHALIAAPTGTGKTLAAFLASLDQLFQDALRGALSDETRVLYVSPLKALSNDIHKNLEEPLAGIRETLRQSEGREVDIRADVRTGDTPARNRQLMLRRPPHILVTTPESFYLLLTSISGRRMLSTVRTVIVDEIHAVVGNRRGSHLALSMERLAALTSHPLQRIGLSATQKPIEEVAKFLVGTSEIATAGEPKCTIVDTGFLRSMDLAIEVPRSSLEAVMSNEVWSEVYARLASLIEEHRTTLIFVNTRRLAERVAHHLGQRLGEDKVTAHHGSLSARLRLEAERRLKSGELRALVATASLELGIDIGSVELVCQIGSARSIATLLQRVGRAGHHRSGIPKGRLFPLSRDELVENVAALSSIRQGRLDAIEMPEKPLDLLAQQMVACAATEEWTEDGLYNLARSAYPYRNLTRHEFDEVLRMLAEGFSTRRGRRAALLHHDAVNHRIRARKGARLVALTAGGAIPDNADYRVLLEPDQVFIGTVNEDFAVESMAGDIFQLGNASWRIIGIQAGNVRVEDAHGQPPSIPFWLGEAPGRTMELSRSVSEFRAALEARIKEALDSDADEKGKTEARVAEWLRNTCAVTESAARQLAEYHLAAYRSLGVLPTRDTLVLERFFDESGGMQLVIHSPFGIRVNRAWGLALRKRFCRSFNFELQAAATDDAIVLSLGTQHSFPLEEVFHYLHSKTVRDLLIQALLDAPMFPTRWRWNASRALALPRQRGGRRIPPPLQRMEAENLLAAVFPDQLACLENIVGDRVVPEHPLVHQTIQDCLEEAMDIEGLTQILRRIERSEIRCIARDLPEPSPLAHEILNAKPYAFLDNAPLEERRTQAVYTRRSSEAATDPGQGILDPAAIDKITAEVWPTAANADELHEALLLAGALTNDEVTRIAPQAEEWLSELAREGRAGVLNGMRRFWIAAERAPMLQVIYTGASVTPPLRAPRRHEEQSWERETAIRELVRGRMEISGPVTPGGLQNDLGLTSTEIEAALLALEAEGFILRGRFRASVDEVEWCERRVLARIHRLTLHRLRAEIQPVSIGDFQHFLSVWQRIETDHRAEGSEGLEAVISLLDGFETSAGAWEPDILSLRVKNYTPDMLDQLCLTGRVGWGRLTSPASRRDQPFAPLRSSPVALFLRPHLTHWSHLVSEAPVPEYTPDTMTVWETLQRSGALFFDELVKRTGVLPSRVEQALTELTAHGRVTADSFQGLRALLTPQERRTSHSTGDLRRRYKTVPGVDSAGRWSLLHRDLREPRSETSAAGSPLRTSALEAFAQALLRRYGIVFRRLLERESLDVTWFELSRIYRRVEAQGVIRGGYFVAGVGGEQFALPEAIGLMRTLRKKARRVEWQTISAADPLNLVGVLTPGPRLPAIASHRILLRDGVPVAALRAGQILRFDNDPSLPDTLIEQRLRIGEMSVALRRYYG